MALTIARTALETCVKQGYHVSVHVLPLKPSTWLRKLVYFLCAGIISDTDRGMSEKRPCVYILASERNSTLYVGVTSNITRRAWEHRSNAAGGFVRDYGVHRLVFVEFHEIMTDAILREKRIKKWAPCVELELIERHTRISSGVSYAAIVRICSLMSFRRKLWANAVKWRSI